MTDLRQTVSRRTGDPSVSPCSKRRRMFGCSRRAITASVKDRRTIVIMGVRRRILRANDALDDGVERFVDSPNTASPER